MSPLARIGRPGRSVLLVLIGAVAGGAAYAVANVPDTSGVIHACLWVTAPGSGVPTSESGNFRIIDPSAPASQSCVPSGTVSEQPIDWNFKGPTGEGGPRGALTHDVTVASPAVKSTASPVGQVNLGTGNQKLSFNFLELGFGSASGGATGGGGAGKVKFDSFTLKKVSDKASPALSLAVTNGKHFPSGVITVRKAGKGKQQFLTIKLTDAFVSSFQEVPSGDKGKPQETVTINFAKVEFKYMPG